MNRRHWLQTLLVAPLAAAITPLLAKPAPAWEGHLEGMQVLTLDGKTWTVIDPMFPAKRELIHIVVDWRTVNDDLASGS